MQENAVSTKEMQRQMVRVAATQMACSKNSTENIGTAKRLVREAAEAGAQIILLQELFQTVYFCQVSRCYLVVHTLWL